MDVFDIEYGVPLGLSYVFISTPCYLKYRSYGTLTVIIGGFFITSSSCFS